MSKRLILFLIANFGLAIFIIFHFFNQNGKVNEKITTQQSVQAIPVVVSKAVPLTSLAVPPKVTTPVPEIKPVVTAPIIQEKSVVDYCLVYGPVQPESKLAIEAILNKANVLSSSHVVSKPVYEIYWDLGNNQVQANSLFDKQKNGGALQSDKFKLKQDKNGMWFVPIAEITADENNAKLTTSELAQKADRLNTGGKWLYRIRENNYFYQFDKGNLIPNEIKSVLEKTFSIPKATC